MAQNGTDPNSATCQWFINLADNGGPPNNLDIRNTLPNGDQVGPYSVFGKVVNNTMTAVDAIAAVPRFNAGPQFETIPLRNYTSPNPVMVSNFVSIPGISPISTLTFSATSSNPSGRGRHRQRHEITRRWPPGRKRDVYRDRDRL